MLKMHFKHHHAEYILLLTKQFLETELLNLYWLQTRKAKQYIEN